MAHVYLITFLVLSTQNHLLLILHRNSIRKWFQTLSISWCWNAFAISNRLEWRMGKRKCISQLISWRFGLFNSSCTGFVVTTGVYLLQFNQNPLSFRGSAFQQNKATPNVCITLCSLTIHNHWYNVIFERITMYAYTDGVEVEWNITVMQASLLWLRAKISKSDLCWHCMHIFSLSVLFWNDKNPRNSMEYFQ